MARLRLQVSLVCVLHIIYIFQQSQCIPVRAQRSERTVSDEKMDELRAKLKNLQTLLSDVKGSKTTSTPVPSTTATPMLSERKVESALQDLLERLTPEEVQALQSVRRKLDEVSQSSKFLPGSNDGSFSFENPQERTVTRQDTDEGSDGEPFTEEELKKASSNPVVNPNTAEFMKDDTTDHHTIDRQLLDDVEARLVADIKYAHAHGIQLEEIFKDMKARSRFLNENSEQDASANK